jgi:cytoskeletal protein CcmA (bactofilin family)
MAFNDLRKGNRTPEPPATGGVGALTAFIDQGSEFSGKLSFKDTVRIDGRFDGEIASENTLIVGESGLVQATIKSQIVIISGEVRGDISAPGQVTLHKTARMSGNIDTARLLIEDGALFNGQVKMDGAEATVSKSSEVGSPKPQLDVNKANGKDAEVSP